MASKEKKLKVTSKNFGDLLLESVGQSIKHAKGEISLRESVAHLTSTPPDYGPSAIKKMRSQFDLTQDLLAQLLGVKSSAVKHWEQGIRRPSASVRRLFQIIQADPSILEKIAS
jgi:DNA-binding transcriptional regulator YiaG